MNTGTVFVATAFLAGLLTVGTPARSQPKATAVKGVVPEFTYHAPADRALVARIREQAGTTVPKALRLEGTLQWRNASESQRWGVTLKWPSLYQQRTATVIHTLEGDVYRTNGGTPPAMQEVARENVRNRFGDLSLLILLRPHVPDVSIKSDGTATVEGKPVRKLVVSNTQGPWLTLYVHATEDRVVASGRPWTIDNESVEQLMIIRERRRVGGMEVPTLMEQLTGKHRAVIAATATVGPSANVDE
ncbi:hypothetical protein [Luteitalea sp.]|uniref:hypothetical protein n=1 Tax=Luteitalea sp. TaxID=2004800 RepID=UPI0025C24041|nr:hypothetical protein [Luteitalea sp.]